MKRVGMLLLVWLLLMVPCAWAEQAHNALPDTLDLPEMGLSIVLDTAWKEMVYQDQLAMTLQYELDAQGQWMQTMALDLYFCPEGVRYMDSQEDYLAWLPDNGQLVLRIVGGKIEYMGAADVAKRFAGQVIEWLPSFDAAYRYAILRSPLPAATSVADGACLEAIEIALERPQEVFLSKKPVRFGAEREWNVTPALPASLQGMRTVDFDQNPVDEMVFGQAKLTVIHIWGVNGMADLSDLQTMGEMAREYAARGVQVFGVPNDIMLSNGSMDTSAYEAACLLVARARANHPQWVPDKVLQSLIDASPYAPVTYFVDAEGRLLGEGVTGNRGLAEWEVLLNAKLAELP